MSFTTPPGSVVLTNKTSQITPMGTSTFPPYNPQQPTKVTSFNTMSPQKAITTNITQPERTQPVITMSPQQSLIQQLQISKMVMAKLASCTNKKDEIIAKSDELYKILNDEIIKNNVKEQPGMLKILLKDNVSKAINETFSLCIDEFLSRDAMIKCGILDSGDAYCKKMSQLNMIIPFMNDFETLIDIYTPLLQKLISKTHMVKQDSYKNCGLTDVGTKIDSVITKIFNLFVNNPFKVNVACQTQDESVYIIIAVVGVLMVVILLVAMINKARQ